MRVIVRSMHPEGPYVMTYLTLTQKPLKLLSGDVTTVPKCLIYNVTESRAVIVTLGYPTPKPSYLIWWRWQKSPVS